MGLVGLRNIFLFWINFDMIIIVCRWLLKMKLWWTVYIQRWEKGSHITMSTLFCQVGLKFFCLFVGLSVSQSVCMSVLSLLYHTPREKHTENVTLSFIFTHCPRQEKILVKCFPNQFNFLDIFQGPIISPPSIEASIISAYQASWINNKGDPSSLKIDMKHYI